MPALRRIVQEDVVAEGRGLRAAYIKSFLSGALRLRIYRFNHLRVSCSGSRGYAVITWGGLGQTVAITAVAAPSVGRDPHR